MVRMVVEATVAKKEHSELALQKRGWGRGRRWSLGWKPDVQGAGREDGSKTGESPGTDGESATEASFATIWNTTRYRFMVFVEFFMFS